MGKENKEIRKLDWANISFTSPRKKAQRKDFDATGRLAEEFFGTNKDKNQITVNKKNEDWIFENIPECVSVIKYGKKIIGFSFIIICNKTIMSCFLKDKISESEMFEKIKKEVNYKNFDCVYLCSSFILSEFRRRGIVSTARTSQIKYLQRKSKKKIVLFAWPFSREGLLAAKQLSKKLKLKFFFKKH